MSKRLFYGDDARNRVLDGVEKLSNTVAVTMGPKGNNVIIGKFVGAPVITKDGVSVAREVVLDDPVEELGCQLVKEAAGRTADVAGDGTTTATVLAHSIFKNGLRLVASGHSPISIRNGISWAQDRVLEKIGELSMPVENSDTLKDIATISANNDPMIGGKIAEAFDSAGWNGTVAAEAFPGDGISVRYIEGAELKSGYISEGFLAGEDTNECVFKNCKILIYDGSMTHINDNLDLFNELSTKNIPILIIANGVKQEALATFLKNKALGRISVCCINFPMWPNDPKEWREDLAMLVGTKIFGPNYGTTLADVSIDDLGGAEKVVVNKWGTKIFGPKKNNKLVNAKIEYYKQCHDNLIGDKVRLGVRDRIALLTSKAAVISVGYSTELELREKGDRIDDALFATKAAISGGVVPGGGTTLLCAANSIDLSALDPKLVPAAEAFLDACKRPFNQICINAGLNPGVIEEKVMLGHEDSDMFGYDVANDRYGDMVEMGILDPTKVTITALKNASSIAILLITTDAVMAENPENESSWQPPAGWRLPSDSGLNHKY